jgi:hypothetical protein
MPKVGEGGEGKGVGVGVGKAGPPRAPCSGPPAAGPRPVGRRGRPRSVTRGWRPGPPPARSRGPPPSPLKPSPWLASRLSPLSPPPTPQYLAFLEAQLAWNNKEGGEGAGGGFLVGPGLTAADLVVGGRAGGRLGRRAAGAAQRAAGGGRGGPCFCVEQALPPPSPSSPPPTPFPPPPTPAPPPPRPTTMWRPSPATTGSGSLQSCPSTPASRRTAPQSGRGRGSRRTSPRTAARRGTRTR